MRRANPPKPVDPDIIALAEEHGRHPEATLAIFRSLHTRHGRLTQAAIADLTCARHVPIERAFGVATFYSMLVVEPPVMSPRSRRVIQMCDGPAWLSPASTFLVSRTPTT